MAPPEIHQLAERLRSNAATTAAKSAPEAVHAERSRASPLGPEERAEEWAAVQRVCSTVRGSFAYRVVEVGPHRVERLVGVAECSPRSVCGLPLRRYGRPATAGIVRE